MRVHVTLKGTLADRLPGGTGDLDLSDGASVGVLAEALNLPGRQCVFVRNGATAGLEEPLRDGDRIQAFPPMAGG